MSTDVASVNLENAETNTPSKKEVKKTTAKISVKALLGYVGSNFKKPKMKNPKLSKKSDAHSSKVKIDAQDSNDTSQPKNSETPSLKDKKEVKATNKTSQPKNSEMSPLKDDKEVQDKLSKAQATQNETKSMSVVPEEWTRPFKQGWRREIVYRGIQNPAKQSKQCDIYYFTPDNAKLRSLPMITDYLAKTNSGLTKECFSFSKQKIYSEPQEIVRNAGEKNGATRNVLDETKNQIRNTKDVPNVKKNGTPVTRRKSRKVEPESHDSKSSTKDDSMKEDIQEILSATLPSNEQNSVPRGIKRKLEEDEKVEGRPQKKIAICDETGRSDHKKKSIIKEGSGKKTSKKSKSSPTNGKRKLIEVEETSTEKCSEKLPSDEMCNSPVTKRRKSDSHETIVEEKSLMETFTSGDIGDTENNPMNHESILHCKSNESNKANDICLPKKETELDDSMGNHDTTFESENLNDKMIKEADNNSYKNSDKVFTHAADEPEKNSFENVDEVVAHVDKVSEKYSIENAVNTHIDDEPDKDSFQNDVPIPVDEVVAHVDKVSEKYSIENAVNTHIDDEPDKDSFHNDVPIHVTSEPEKDSFENDKELVTHADNKLEKESFQNDKELVTHADDKLEKESFQNDEELVTHADDKLEKESFQNDKELVTHVDDEPRKDSFQNDNELVTHVDNEPEKDSFEFDKELVTHTADETENDEAVSLVDNEPDTEPLQQDNEATGTQTSEYLQRDGSSMLSENSFDEKENISETLQESNAKFQELAEGRVLREILPEVDNSPAESSQDVKLSEQKHADVSSENSAFKEEVTNDLNDQYLKSDIAKKSKIVCSVCMHEQDIDSDLMTEEPVCEACVAISKENELIRNYKCEAEINNTNHSLQGEKDKGCVTQSVDTMSLANFHTIVVDENICSLLDVTKKFNLLVKDHIRLVEPGHTFVDSAGLNIRLKIPLPPELMRPSQPLKVIYKGGSDIQRLIVIFDEES